LSGDNDEAQEGREEISLKKGDGKAIHWRGECLVWEASWEDTNGEGGSD